MDLKPDSREALAVSRTLARGLCPALPGPLRSHRGHSREGAALGGGPAHTKFRPRSFALWDPRTPHPRQGGNPRAPAAPQSLPAPAGIGPSQPAPPGTARPPAFYPSTAHAFP